jgi:hypothetical protein
MIRFKDSEPTKGKGATAKSDEKETAKLAAAKSSPASSEPEPERAPKAAAKRKKNFGG